MEDQGNPGALAARRGGWASILPHQFAVPMPKAQLNRERSPNDESTHPRADLMARAVFSTTQPQQRTALVLQLGPWCQREQDHAALGKSQPQERMSKCWGEAELNCHLLWWLRAHVGVLQQTGARDAQPVIRAAPLATGPQVERFRMMLLAE